MEEVLQNAPNKSGSVSHMPVSTGDAPLCNLLLTEKKVTLEELDRSRELQSENGVGLGILLVRLGLVSDRDMLSLQRKLTNLPELNDQDIPELPILSEQLSQKFLQETYILPVEVTDDAVSIAMADPGDEFSIRAVELACNKEVQIKLATTTQIENALDRLYGDGNSKLADIVEEIESNDEETYSESIERLKDMAGEAPIIRLVSLMINRAIALLHDNF